MCAPSRLIHTLNTSQPLAIQQFTIMTSWTDCEYPANSSFLRKLLPLLLLLIVLAFMGIVLYVVHITALEVSSRASEKMQQNNVLLSKSGMTVGIKAVENECYVDVTQNFLVKTWNLSSRPENRAQSRSGCKSNTENTVRKKLSFVKLSQSTLSKFC